MSEVDTVLVTGASGFVGSAVARAAIQAGYRVRALMRNSSPRDNLTGLDLEIVQGDMRDPLSLQRAMAGTRYVFHVAADYRLWALDPEEIVRTNLEGTRNIMEAAAHRGVERVVYTSSVATIPTRADRTPASETDHMPEHAAIGAYKRSKLAAERLVLSLVAERALPVVIVNPSTPVGPRDIKPTPTGRIIVEAANGRMPGYIDTGLNLVHVDDVAAGHIAALLHGKIGERYILGGTNVTLAQLLADIARLAGRSPPRLRLPRSLIYPVAIAAELVARLTKREPFVTIDGLRMAKHWMYFDSSKAQRELGYQARPYVEGLRDAIAWFRQAGYVK